MMSTATRITLDDIEAKVVAENYVTQGMLTICILTLSNGYQVTGKSGCADPANYDAELGHRIARKNAINEVWPLEGYLLREQLHQRNQS